MSRGDLCPRPADVPDTPAVQGDEGGPPEDRACRQQYAEIGWLWLAENGYQTDIDLRESRASRRSHGRFGGLQWFRPFHKPGTSHQLLFREYMQQFLPHMS